MKFISFDGPRQFLNFTGDFLKKKESANNLILGLSDRLLQMESKEEQIKETYLFAVEDQNGDCILAILLNNINLILYGEGQDREEAVHLAASEISNLGLHVPGVVGPIAAASQFAAEWAVLTGLEPFIKMNQRIYQLDKVSNITYRTGYLRLAEKRDLPLVAEWIDDFIETIGESTSKEESIKKANAFIDESSLYLWEDHGVPVSMAKKSRPLKNGVVISCVYTPPQFRRNGYATFCVASLSQLLLQNGKSFCSLYTDLANPTSNRIYQDIGYYPVMDSVMYRFRDEA